MPATYAKTEDEIEGETQKRQRPQMSNYIFAHGHAAETLMPRLPMDKLEASGFTLPLLGIGRKS